VKKQKSLKNILFVSVVVLAVAIIALFVIMGTDKKIDIGTDRQFMWNSGIIDEEKTTAQLTQFSPVKQDIVFTVDKDWEGTVADSFNIVADDDGYRMYYATYSSKDDVKICYAHSKDGISWEKPDVNLVVNNGSAANNILLNGTQGITNGFFVFKDTNENTETGEKYKAVAVKNDSIVCFISHDGIVWQEKSVMSKNNVSDINSAATLSSVFWSKEHQRYFCYYVKTNGNDKCIMLTTSENFEKWSKPKEVTYNSKAFYDMQTANVMPYYRGEDMFIGLPLRVTAVDDAALDNNFADNTVKTSTITDTVFVSSTDGYKFDITEEAWLAPGAQNGSNWMFGDSFVANGLVETPSIHSQNGQDNDLSVYVAENISSGVNTDLARYTMRIDGFAGYNAPFSTRKVVTKPLKFDGSRMTVNFRTSTNGYVFVRFLDKNGKPFEEIEYTKEDGTQYSVPKYTSYKLIGDRVDREIVFNGDIAELAGETVVIEFYLSDADVFSFKFDDEKYHTEGEWLPEEIEIREYEDFRYENTDEIIDIGSERQLFWDNYIVDETKTDARIVKRSPERKEEIFKTDLPWEGDNCDFYVIMDDVDSEGKAYHRMYYLGWDSSDFTDIRVCYAYSYDGSNWVKPNLGLHSYTDKNTGITHTQTNIVLYTEEDTFDNFFVMKDTREGVPDSQRYKAICQGSYDQLGYPSYGLWAWVSPDGLHWKKTHRVLPQADNWFGSFDSVNTLVWDEFTQKFFTYFRVRENQEYNGTEFIDFRKIYGATGNEFEPFDTETVFALNFGENAPLFEMYTNNITKYYRAPQMFIGFPTRFSRNFVWQKNYEYLTDPVARLEKFNEGQLTRTLSMTDNMFMTSRDGYTWNRQNEAFITPGPEYQANWIYGNCYPAYGLVETAGDSPDEDKQLSTYLFEGKFYKEPSVLYRYVLRLDGFRSYKGDMSTQKVTTKQLTFDGSEMYVNFKTSAAGNVKINILDENGKKIEGYSSAVLIGDNTDRKVVFEKDLSLLNGRNVAVEFVLTDAEIYSFVFQ